MGHLPTDREWELLELGCEDFYGLWEVADRKQAIRSLLDQDLISLYWAGVTMFAPEPTQKALPKHEAYQALSRSESWETPKSVDWRQIGSLCYAATDSAASQARPPKEPMRRLRPTGWLLLVAAVILFVGSVYMTVIGSTEGSFWSWVALLFVIVAFEFYRRSSR